MADDEDPLSLERVTTSETTNGKTETTTFDAGTTITVTSPEGRRSSKARRQGPAVARDRARS